MVGELYGITFCTPSNYPFAAYVCIDRPRGYHIKFDSNLLPYKVCFTVHALLAFKRY